MSRLADDCRSGATGALVGQALCPQARASLMAVGAAMSRANASEGEVSKVLDHRIILAFVDDAALSFFENLSEFERVPSFAIREYATEDSPSFDVAVEQHRVGHM